MHMLGVDEYKNERNTQTTAELVCWSTFTEGCELTFCRLPFPDFSGGEQGAISNAIV